MSRRSTFIMITIVFCVALVLAGCNKKPEPNDANAAEKTVRVIPVSVDTVVTGEFARTVRATGTIIPSHEALISAGVNGQIEKLHVQVGDWLAAGDLILEIDPEFHQAQAEQAQAAYDKAKSDLDRNEKLYSTKDISDAVIEAARVQEKSALVALKSAQKQLGDARVRSPFRGWVASLPVELGSTVSNGVPMVTVVDIYEVKLQIGVSDKDVIHLKPGQKARISLDVYPEREFSGKVTAVGPQAKAESRLFPVEIAIQNTQDLALRGGMVATAEVEYERLKNAVLLPQDAITERSGETLVFTVENQVTHSRTPQLGGKEGEYYLVLGGLKVGELVVVAGQQSLSEGTQVEVAR